MKDDWWCWDKMDTENKSLAVFAKQLCGGMCNAYAAAA